MAFINQDRKTSIQSDRLNLKQTPADIWEYDDANKTSTPKIWLKDGWSLVDVLYPVGAFYTQYPNANSNDLDVAFPAAYAPTALYGGVWEKQWDTEGIDFHTERTSDTGLQTRTDGLQLDQGQLIEGEMTTSLGRGVGVSLWGTGSGALKRGTSTATLGYPSLGGSASIVTNFTFKSSDSVDARTGTVTCDSNRLVRIWKRTE